MLDDLVTFHPFICSGAKSQANAKFLANGQAERKLSSALIKDDAFAPFTKESLGEMRRSSPRRRADLASMRSESPTSCSPSTRSPPTASSTREGLLGLWQTSGRLVCEVRDLGYIEDPLVGRRRPKTTEERGRGIWFAHQVADLIQCATPSGTTVRILFDCVSGS